MADFNQKQPGQTLTSLSDAERKKLISRNPYNAVDEYNTSHPNAVSDGDPKGKGNAKFLGVYDNDNTGGSIDILGNGEAHTGRIGNVTTNLYSRDNEYSPGNLDSGNGYTPTVENNV